MYEAFFLRSVTEPCRLNFKHYIWSKTSLRFFNQLSRTKWQIKVKQRSYLEAKFSIGQATGRKLDADIVAREMRHALGSDERRLFKSSEFQTEQQITSYFSRLSTKVRQQLETTEEDIWAIFSLLWTWNTPLYLINTTSVIWFVTTGWRTSNWFYARCYARNLTCKAPSEIAGRKRHTFYNYYTDNMTTIRVYLAAR